MTVLRKLGATGLVTAATTAFVLSTTGTAFASSNSGRLFATYDACVAYGNQQAQQGKIHNFFCSKNTEVGTGHVNYELHVTG